MCSLVVPGSQSYSAGYKSRISNLRFLFGANVWPLELGAQVFHGWIMVQSHVVQIDVVVAEDHRSRRLNPLLCVQLVALLRMN